jgi:hypothetical protein
MPDPASNAQREARRGDDRERLPEDVPVYADEAFDGLPKLHAWVCPYCGRQYPGPRGHHVAGDDSATSCFHRRPGERGLVQPRLVLIEVAPVEPFAPRVIPADRIPSHAASTEGTDA